MSHLADLEWLRERFHDLSEKCGEDRNTRAEHDVEDAAERARADRIISAVVAKMAGAAQ